MSPHTASVPQSAVAITADAVRSRGQSGKTRGPRSTWLQLVPRPGGRLSELANEVISNQTIHDQVGHGRPRYRASSHGPELDC